MLLNADSGRTPPRLSRRNYVTCDTSSLFACGAINVVVSYKSDLVVCGGSGNHATLLELFEDRGGIGVAANGEDDDVGLDGGEVDLDLRQLGKALGEEARVGMVFGEAL